MKTFFLFFLLTNLCLAQIEVHNYEISDNLILYNTGDYIITHNYEDTSCSSDLSYMDENSIVIDNVSYDYRLNKIVLDNKTYRFKKPWFSNKAYLVDVKSGNVLIKYRTCHKMLNAQQEIIDDNWKLLDSSVQKILLSWALNKQVRYALYNHEDKYESIKLISSSIGLFL